MRTKLLLCAAALAVSALTSMAQVYSLNIVGYYQVTCNPGYTIVANQLTASPDNTLGSVVPDQNFPVNSSLMFFNNGFTEITYYGGGLWDDSTVDFSPGVAAFMKNLESTPYTMTFVGQVPTGTLTQTLAPGFSLVGHKVPQAGNLQTDMNLQPNANDSVLFYSGGYQEDIYYGDGLWDFDPTVAVGQGFFYKNQGAQVTWTRTFNP